MKTTLNYEFADNEEDRYYRISNGDTFYQVSKDLKGWINKQIEENPYYDKETLEYVDDKLNEILLNYGVSI